MVGIGEVFLLLSRRGRGAGPAAWRGRNWPRSPECCSGATWGGRVWHGCFSGNRAGGKSDRIL